LGPGNLLAELQNTSRSCR